MQILERRSAIGVGGQSGNVLSLMVMGQTQSKLIERDFTDEMSLSAGRLTLLALAPRSIVSYRSAHMIREFIRHPSAYRVTRMPDHPDFTETDLDDLLDYFWHQRKRL